MSSHTGPDGFFTQHNVAGPSLPEFLLARIDWELRVYRGCQHGVPQDLADHLIRDLEAKRGIVETCALVIQAFDDGVMWSNVNRRERSHARRFIHALADVYSDHPDYRQEWAA